MSLTTPTPPPLNLSSARVRVSTNHLQFRLLPPSPSLISKTIRFGGGPRTFPGGVSKWQWKRMQAKKAKQLLKARLIRERQTYEMRKRAELSAAVSELERPWELVQRSAPTLFSVKADEQLKALADRFQKPGGYDLWSERDGPQLFWTPEGIPTARFFPKGVVHSVKPYGKFDGGDEDGGSRRGRRKRRSSDLDGGDKGDVEDLGVLELEEGVGEIGLEEPGFDDAKFKQESFYGRRDRDRRGVVVRGNSGKEEGNGGRGGNSLVRRRSLDWRGVEGFDDDSGIWNGRDEGEGEDIGMLGLEDGVKDIRIGEQKIKQESSYKGSDRGGRGVVGRGNSEREVRVGGGRRVSSYSKSRSHGDRSSKYRVKDRIFDCGHIGRRGDRRSSDGSGVEGLDDDFDGDLGILNGRDEGDVEDVGTLGLVEGFREIRIEEPDVGGSNCRRVNGAMVKQERTSYNGRNRNRRGVVGRGNSEGEMRNEEPDVGVSNRRRIDGAMVKHERGSYDGRDCNRRGDVGRGNLEREMRFGGGRGGRMVSYSGSRSHVNRSSNLRAKDLLDDLVLNRTDEEKRGRAPLNGDRYNSGRTRSR